MSAAAGWPAREDAIRVAGLVMDSIVDGPGIRVAIFCQGCPHHCPGCHNPESWAFAGGQEMTVAALEAAVHSNPLCRGVTFSGGEPFSQAAAFGALARRLKAAGYEVAAYTGYTFEALRDEGDAAQKALLASLDVLVDGPFVQARRNLDLRFRGSDNQRILDVPKSLAAGKAVWYEGERWTGPRPRL